MQWFEQATYRECSTERAHHTQRDQQLTGSAQLKEHVTLRETSNLRRVLIWKSTLHSERPATYWECSTERARYTQRDTQLTEHAQLKEHITLIEWQLTSHKFHLDRLFRNIHQQFRNIPVHFNISFTSHLLENKLAVQIYNSNHWLDSNLHTEATFGLFLS